MSKNDIKSRREYCNYCGRSVHALDATYTDDGLVHIGCHTLTGHTRDARPGRRRGQLPDFQAPSLASQEYIRRTAFCYATLFHNPIKRRKINPRVRKY